MLPDVLTALRNATRDAHARLEQDLDTLSAVATPQGRRQVARGFHGLHAGAEMALAPLLSSVPGLDYHQRLRRPLLDADLAVLGVAQPAACTVPPPVGLPEALGLLYVLEGSTLGGQVIGKRLRALGQSMTGLTFLNPYGPLTGERWKGFIAVLHRECPDQASAQRAAQAGADGFALAHDWLCREGADA